MRFLLALLCGVLAFPASLQAQTETSRMRFAHWIYQDLGGLAQASFTPRMGLYAAGTAGGTLLLAQFDDEANPAVRSIKEGVIEDFFDATDYLGGPNVNVYVVSTFGLSLLTPYTRFQDAAFTSLQTLIYAGGLGYLMKFALQRQRAENQTDFQNEAIYDEDDYDPYAFFTESGNSSYPSGHAIASFGIITPWVLYYPSPFTYALYALPIGTSLSRLSRDKHWGTDILVGALIGISMGRWLTVRHRRVQGQYAASAPERVQFNMGPTGFAMRVRLGQ